MQGVKVILFTKYLWADQAMDWFRHGYTGNEADGRPLRADAIKDPYQDYYQGPGYRFVLGTSTAATIYTPVPNPLSLPFSSELNAVLPPSLPP